jgi:glycosyltransferase involved in cell wall biosynthesis
MTFSICIPLYNGIEYISDTLNSVKSQSFSDWECLIGINGHGKDGGDVYKKLIEILSKLNDDRFKVYIFEDIKNAPLTINKLVELSKSDWIAHLDADDIWESNKLEEQYKIIHSENVDIIGTWCQYFQEKMTIPKLPSKFIDSAFWYYINPLIHSSVVIKKNLAHYTTQFVCYDLDCWLRHFKDGKKFYVVDQILVKHRVYSNSHFNASGGQDPRIVRLKYLKDKYTSV